MTHCKKRVHTWEDTYHEQLLLFVSLYYFPQGRPAVRKKRSPRKGHALHQCDTCRHITRALTSLGSKYDLASMFSRWRYLSGFSCFSLIIGSVCRRRERAAPNSRSSISSRTICGMKMGTDWDEKSQSQNPFFPEKLFSCFSKKKNNKRIIFYMQLGS